MYVVAPLAGKWSAFGTGAHAAPQLYAPGGLFMEYTFVFIRPQLKMLPIKFSFAVLFFLFMSKFCPAPFSIQRVLCDVLFMDRDWDWLAHLPHCDCVRINTRLTVEVLSRLPDFNVDFFNDDRPMAAHNCQRISLYMVFY